VGIYFLRTASDLQIAFEEDEFARERYEEEEGEEGRTDEPGKFLEFHLGIRTRDGEDGPDYEANYKWRELAEARKNSFARRRTNTRTQSTDVLEWKERGPANVPGRTRALFNVPGDASNNTWLAGSATGGIWRTTNGGLAWSERSKDFPALPISCFAADAGANVIYASTGEFTSSVYSAIGNGIFKSMDKGISWTQLSATATSQFSIITRMIVHPTDPNIILATTVPSNISKDTKSAIMRSIDGGATWTKTKEITGYFEQIIASPDNFNTQYATQQDVGVWKSTDAGVTWNLSNTGMTVTGRVEISISRINTNKIFASAEGSLTGKTSDLYFSSNAGQTWSLVDVSFNNSTVDVLEGQGFYDNTILCDPFNENRVYVGGVSMFRITLASGSSQVNNYKFQEVNTSSFLFLQSFSGIIYDNQRLTVGSDNGNITVEIRFGPGMNQKAHRFLVPATATSGVSAQDYAYTDFITVPFQVWDVTNNQQLSASFRDQNRNGKFDLVPPALQTTDPPTSQSREYIYIENVPYSPLSANNNIALAGGQEYKLMYSFFPALATSATWNESTLPSSKLVVGNFMITKLNATTETVADGRGSYDNKNKSNQSNLPAGVHPDHHTLVPVIISEAASTFKLLLGNDGGVFVSKVSANPGVTEGDWEFRGYGYNTSQFYGADTKPGSQEYVGGMQDNGTRFSPIGKTADATSEYSFGIGGDGFEAIWNSRDPNKIIGSVYNGQLSRSANAGLTWISSNSGYTPSSTDFPFITKLANSKDFPDRIFTVGRAGVYVSQNFGTSWELTAINNKFLPASGSPFYLDVEVSRANANIVWAGSGMTTSGTIRNLFVSQDGGTTFAATTNYTTVNLGNITKLASHPSEEKTAYALFSFANGPKILRTTNLGQTWTDISGFGAGSVSTNGFPDVAVFCLYVRPDNTNILWAGTEIGIVESTDNGATWALREDFPNVSVWDMKGQDNEVVIATHGRGIWTATLTNIQSAIISPEIVAAGTSPFQKFMVRIKAVNGFDSVQVYVNNTLATSLKPFPSGTADVEIPNTTFGSNEIRLIGYVGNAPFQSMKTTANYFSLLTAKSSYATYFNTMSDLVVDGFTLQNYPNTSAQLRKSLQTNHDYTSNKIYEAIVRTPIAVSNVNPILYYSDVTIIEPKNDSVFVEATKNGLDWVKLSSPYDASFPGDVQHKWQTAFSNNQPGSVSMLVAHEIDISKNFSHGDLVLFRWRLVSGPAITSWGWAIDYISIQQLPTGVIVKQAPETFTLYPNPAKSTMNVEYYVDKPGNFSIEIIDLFGRSLKSLDIGLKQQGLQQELIPVENLQRGNYVLLLKSESGKRVSKFSVE
jgi:photosystem II stability/assembly factor-like uncharacterized protein